MIQNLLSEYIEFILAYGYQQAVSRFLVSPWLARMTQLFLSRMEEFLVIPDRDEGARDCFVKSIGISVVMFA